MGFHGNVEYIICNEWLKRIHSVSISSKVTSSLSRKAKTTKKKKHKKTKSLVQITYREIEQQKSLRIATNRPKLATGSPDRQPDGRNPKAWAMKKIRQKLRRCARIDIEDKESITAEDLTIKLVPTFMGFQGIVIFVQKSKFCYIF